uniref:Uncharacterized protein n=1 Tax=uncultured alpha proteobacterium HF0070_05I22 TaxID=710803 RepID=E0XX84_9PROT|nr:hypothetical protein [uncultured alpha proteobacterium HF0070_05I22]
MATKLKFVSRVCLHIICQIKISTGFADKVGFVVRFIYQLPGKAGIGLSKAKNITNLVP